LLIHADIPGASAESIDVDFEDGLLTISAQVPERNGNREYLLREYEIGDYRRTFRVSEAIDVSQITAEFKDGVLTLRLPKSANVKARKISVNTAG
jgi:HSP20 family protein